VAKIRDREEQVKGPAEKNLPTSPCPEASRTRAPVLAGELKDRVLQEYETYRDRPDHPLKKIHQEIARKLGIKRALVFEALQGMAKRRVLTPRKKPRSSNVTGTTWKG